MQGIFAQKSVFMGCIFARICVYYNQRIHYGGKLYVSEKENRRIFNELEE